jgi:hypothetical protein
MGAMKHVTSGRPRTAHELNALPEGPAFGEGECIINGQLCRVPIAREVVAIYHDEDDIISWLGPDGERWMIGRYVDGTWFKQRR